MGRAFLPQGFIGGIAEALALDIFLQSALGVGLPRLSTVADQSVHHVPCGVHPPVQIHGGQYSLKRVAQHGRIRPPARDFAAAVHHQRFAHVNRRRGLRQLFLPHQLLPQARHGPLVHFRVIGVNFFAHAKLQHRVAQKFQPLVMLVPQGWMGERLPEQGGLFECVANRPLEGL